MNLPKPFDTFAVEKHAGEYKDFGAQQSDYPLKGVTYPVDYGDIEGYLGEDGAKLDFFVGTSGDIFGWIVVSRPDLEKGEHKFYINLTEDEETAVLNEFAPVVIEHERLDSLDAVAEAIKPFQIQE